MYKNGEHFKLSHQALNSFLNHEVDEKYDQVKRFNFADVHNVQHIVRRKIVLRNARVHPRFSGVRVAHSSVFCVVFYRSLFARCNCSLCHCLPVVIVLYVIVCPL